MPPKTLNHLLQQTAGTGRLIKGQCSSGSPPLISFPVLQNRSDDYVRCGNEGP